MTRSGGGNVFSERTWEERAVANRFDPHHET
jgi:hypothetical protein